MKLIIESTTKVVTLDGVACRVWEGQTAHGVKVHAFIPRVAVTDGQDTSQFEAELSEHRAPSIEIEAIPFRMLL